MQRRYLIVTLLLAILASSCGSSPYAGLEANKELTRRFVAAVNATDWDALDEIVAEDFRRHCQATPDVQVRSREEFKQLLESFLVSIPDQRMTIEMLVAEGDKVAGYGTYAGTQTGPMEGFPATGKPVEAKFMTILRIEEGRIAELWVEWDNMAMLAQLGLFPPPAPPENEEG
jgi:steroid delta-isomerase-like uncharacterized protein